MGGGLVVELLWLGNGITQPENSNMYGESIFCISQ